MSGQPPVFEARHRQQIVAVAGAIRFWREMRQMTQSQLAEKAGVSRGRIVQWETKVALPTLPRLWDLAVALQVEPSRLLADRLPYDLNEPPKRGRPRKAQPQEIQP